MKDLRRRAVTRRCLAGAAILALSSGAALAHPTMARLSQEAGAKGKPAEKSRLSPRKRGITALDYAFLKARRDNWGGVALAEELGRVGTADTLFAALAKGGFRVRVGDRGAISETLRPDERRALIHSFSGVPLPSFRKVLNSFDLDEVSQPQRVAALEVMGHHGEAVDVLRMLEWAQVEGAKSRIPRSVRAAFGEQLHGLVIRAPDTLTIIPAVYTAANLSLLPSLLSGLDPAHEPSHLALVCELLGRVPEFDLYLLAEIASSSANLSYESDKELAAKVRPYLIGSDVNAAREAITAAMHFGDRDAIDSLIKRLDGAPSMRSRALKALSSITGQQLAPSREAWTEWHKSAQLWWSREAPKLMDRAASAAPGVASRAIQKLSMARMYRHELVAPLLLALHRDEVEIVVLTSAVLGHLGSKHAIAPLVAQLRNGNEDIRRAAYQALRRLTGENYGDDAEAWLRAGWGDGSETEHQRVPK